MISGSRRRAAATPKDWASSLGIPADLAAALTTLGIGLPIATKIARAGIPWPFVHSLLGTPGLRNAEDVSGLIVLWDERSPDVVLTWSRIGSLTAAYRLDAQGVRPDLARQFPLEPGQPLGDLVRMVQEAHRVGIHVEDLLLWHTGGVLRCTGPFLDEGAFATWRSTAVQHIGMRRAAVACAAGLSPAEAITQVRTGEFDEARLRMLAALRH